MTLPFLPGWEGRSPDQLIALADRHRVDSIVLAFEEAILMKAHKLGDASLAEIESDVIAIESLEREVNNGGYHQFFTNSSVEHVPRVVGALSRIGCFTTSELTQRAIQTVIGDDPATVAAITAAMESDNRARNDTLNEIDQAYYISGEDIAEALFRRLRLRQADITFA